MDERVLVKSFFADGTADYCIPPEPEPYSKVRLRFRAAKDCARTVWLCHSSYNDRMVKTETDGQFDYYDIEIALSNKTFHYHYKVATPYGTWRYGKEGPVEGDGILLDFTISPGFSTPDWAKGAVMYQIFVDRFYNGDPSNDVLNDEYFYIDRNVRQIDNWYKAPEDFDVAEFYGGDLAGVMKKLDYLKDLGVEVIYFNPIFVSPSSHKYDIQDYDYIDPHFGVIEEDLVEEDEAKLWTPSDGERYKKRVTSRVNLNASNNLFAVLVAQAHARGIRVIIDGVFNHCGSFNKWLDREGIYRDAAGFHDGAYVSKDSPFFDFFHFYDPDAYPNNDTYEGWWGHATLPKLNYEESPTLEAFILHIAQKWVSAPYHADGWRLDVAADLGRSEEYNHTFWRKFRQAVKEANPNAVIIAEHYGDPSPWLEGDQWDTVMNYDAFMEPVSWFLTGMEKHSEAFSQELLGDPLYLRDTLKKNMARFLTPSLQCAMNQLSNHDHSRFLTRTNHKVGRARDLGVSAASEGVNKGVFKNAVVMQMTLPGAPTLYYGDEAGLCGFTDPDNRRCYPWGREDKELLDFHKKVIHIHRSYQVLKTGSVIELNGSKNIIAFARFSREEQIVVVINNDAYSRDIVMDVWPTGIPKESTLRQLLYAQAEQTSISPVHYTVTDGVLSISLPRYSAVILVRE